MCVNGITEIECIRCKEWQWGVLSFPLLRSIYVNSDICTKCINDILNERKAICETAKGLEETNPKIKVINGKDHMYCRECTIYKLPTVFRIYKGNKIGNCKVCVKKCIKNALLKIQNPNIKKVCTGCNFNKYSYEFNDAIYELDGYNKLCKKCITVQRIERILRILREKRKNNKKVKCEDCGKEKRYTRFRPSTKSSTGCYKYCKKCCAKYRKKYKEYMKSTLEKRQSKHTHLYCPKCRFTHPVKKFYAATYEETGYQKECITCSKATQKENHKRKMETNPQYRIKYTVWNMITKYPQHVRNLDQ